MGMKTIAFVLAVLATPAFADEVIEIHDHPVQPAKQTSRDPRVLPPYSDAAIESNTWARAWMLLSIDSTGFVTRVKMLNAPGHDLDAIAIDRAFHTRFSPARDRRGNAVASELVWGLEWPAYWWMIDNFGFALRLPHFGNIEDAHAPMCRGEGPLDLGYMKTSAVYRDCSQPALERAQQVAWIYPRAATTNFK